MSKQNNPVVKTETMTGISMQTGKETVLTVQTHKDGSISSTSKDK